MDTVSIIATTRSKYSDIRYNRFTKRNDLTLIAVYTYMQNNVENLLHDKCTVHRVKSKIHVELYIRIARKL